ncbi:probable protein phosphatase 2C 56 [Phragmites australis]|uniref:probable protein phosphatase 2C 56 n=1 Tax=Phragmites australis TaxID=29695 RepID=UPI002D79F33F|nr:probable protein phosphatase 2C 56 [Phragmites australis]
MARAATLRGLIGIAAAGGRRVRSCGQRWDAGWRAFRAGASGGRAAPGSSSSASARRQAQPLRGAAAGAGNNDWVSGGFKSEDGKLTCGYSSYKGRRSTMEDCYDIKLTEIDGQPVNLFGVFDGHGGNLAAEYLKENLFKDLMKHPAFLTDTKLAISRTFLETDKDILETISISGLFRDDGSTALAAILIGERLYVANVGDSRAVASKSGKAIPLSKDHKPNRKDERKRIEDAGGVVIRDDTWRVGGILAMSRAFGNRLLKQYVKADPDIQEQEVNSDLKYLILATDGLWDVVRNEEAISLLKAEDGPQAAAVKLTEIAYSRQSTDNITCIVVQFHHDKSWGSKAESSS